MYENNSQINSVYDVGARVPKALSMENRYEFQFKNTVKSYFYK